MTNNHCQSNLNLISSEIFTKESLNLSFYNKDIIRCVLNLDIYQDDDLSFETLKKYIYFANFFILNIDKDFYFINSSYIEPYYSDMKPLKIADYKVHQRKDKLKKIEQQTKDE